MKLRQLPEKNLRSARQRERPLPPLPSHPPPSSRGERPMRRRRGSPTLRFAADPATHRFEQSRRAPFVVAIASVSPPGGPYRWRWRKGASPVCLRLSRGNRPTQTDGSPPDTPGEILPIGCSRRPRQDLGVLCGSVLRTGCLERNGITAEAPRTPRRQSSRHFGNLALSREGKESAWHLRAFGAPG